MKGPQRGFRILLAHEESLFRELVKGVLTDDDLLVVGQARAGPEALARVEELRPDVLVVSVSLPGGDGIAITRSVKRLLPDCRVIVVNDFEEQDVLVEAVEAGANAFLTSSSTADDLIEAIRADAATVLVPPGTLPVLVTQLVERLHEQEETIDQISRLTPREQEILSYLVEGAGTTAIAESLTISPQTARTHIQNLLGKLGAHSRLQAVAMVRRNRRFEQLLKRRIPVRWSNSSQ